MYSVHSAPSAGKLSVNLRHLRENPSHIFWRTINYLLS